MNRRAVVSYADDMYEQLAVLLEDIGHPLAKEDRKIATLIRETQQFYEDEPAKLMR